MDINLEYYKIFYYVAGSQSITLGGAAYHLAACSQPGCEAFRTGAFVPIVCADDQGRAADEGGGDALFLCAARL